jgi:hypothetical protein
MPVARRSDMNRRMSTWSIWPIGRSPNTGTMWTRSWRS